MSVVPRGMEEIVDYVKERYNNIPMYITENGEFFLLLFCTFITDKLCSCYSDKWILLN